MATAHWEALLLLLLLFREPKFLLRANMVVRCRAIDESQVPLLANVWLQFSMPCEVIVQIDFRTLLAQFPRYWFLSDEAACRGFVILAVQYWHRIFVWVGWVALWLCRLKSYFEISVRSQYLVCDRQALVVVCVEGCRGRTLDIAQLIVRLQSLIPITRRLWRIFYLWISLHRRWAADQAAINFGVSIVIYLIIYWCIARQGIVQTLLRTAKPLCLLGIPKIGLERWHLEAGSCIVHIWYRFCAVHQWSRLDLALVLFGNVVLALVLYNRWCVPVWLGHHLSNIVVPILITFPQIVKHIGCIHIVVCDRAGLFCLSQVQILAYVVPFLRAVRQVERVHFLVVVAPIILAYAGYGRRCVLQVLARSLARLLSGIVVLLPIS